MDARDTLIDRLRDAGIAQERIDDAERAGHFTTLAVEVALGAHGRHSLTAVSRASGVPTPMLRELLQAIGRPNPERGGRPFTDEDIELAKIVRALLDGGLPRGPIIDVARVIGHSTSQIAEALRQLVGDALLKRGDSEDELAVRYAEAADDLAPLVPALLHLVVRAHLRDGLQRELISEAERRSGRLADTRDVAVAFVDLAGYTKLGNSVGSVVLSSIAGRLGEIVTAAARRPVRIVKMVGDAAMLVSPAVPEMVETLLEVQRQVVRSDDLPPVRVGATYGPATARGGDWYGATVNLASRLTQSAKPGQMLVTAEVVERAPGEDWNRRRKVRLKGMDGRIRVYDSALT